MPEAAPPRSSPFLATAAPSGREPRPHLVALGIPPTTAAASWGHPAPLCGYSDPKRNGAYIPWREVCEPFPVRGGEERRRSPPCAAWELGDAQLPILGSGAMCHPLDCLGTLASPSPWWDTVPRSSFAPSSSRSWEKGAGAWRGVILSIPTFPTAAFPPKRQLRPLPQSLPCFRGSGRGRAGCDPLVSPQNPKKEREGEPRRVRMSRDTLGDF